MSFYSALQSRDPPNKKLPFQQLRCRPFSPQCTLSSGLVGRPMKGASHCTHSQEVEAETWGGSDKLLSGEGQHLISSSGSKECCLQPVPCTSGAPTVPCHAAKGHPTDARKPGQWPSDLSLNHTGTNSFFFSSLSLSVSLPHGFLYVSKSE